MQPAIIIIAFNRPHSLKRILSSVSRAHYEVENVPLVICIDHKDSDLNKEVVKIANAFSWKYGPKKIIKQKVNLGLKKHVLLCGDLVEEYDSIIMLEDDLFVSPYYYTYAVKALEYYNSDNKVAGISLYNHRLNFNNLFPFIPISDHSDVYFLQVASSWGQAWTKSQWRGFRNWFEKNPEIDRQINMPDYILNWPNSSWLKHFIHYMVAKDKFFVFPRVSYTTNFSDSGTNVSASKTFFQVPLHMDYATRFSYLSDSKSVYDSFFELLPSCYKFYTETLNPYKFESDLYGLKKLDKIKTEYLLTSKKGMHPVLTFGLEMKPMVMNILQNIDGDFFRLEKVETLLSNSLLDKPGQKNIFNYIFGSIPPNIKIKNLVDISIKKIFQKM